MDIAKRLEETEKKLLQERREILRLREEEKVRIDRALRLEGQYALLKEMVSEEKKEG